MKELFFNNLNHPSTSGKLFACRYFFKNMLSNIHGLVQRLRDANGLTLKIKNEHFQLLYKEISVNIRRSPFHHVLKMIKNITGGIYEQRSSICRWY